MHHVFQVLTDNLMSKETGEEIKKLSQIEKELERIKELEAKVEETLKSHTSLEQMFQPKESTGIDEKGSYLSYLNHLENLLIGFKTTIETMDGACEESQRKLQESVDSLRDFDWNHLEDIPNLSQDMSLDSLITKIETRLENINIMLFELTQVTCKPREESGMNNNDDPIDLDNIHHLMKHECQHPLFVKTSSKSSASVGSTFQEKLSSLNEMNRKYLENRRQILYKCLKKIQTLRL